MVEVHPSLEPVAGWLGTWSGRGRGEYPTIEPFEYDETITLGHAGKPLMAYTQRTTAPDGGRSLHAESGFWRRGETGTVELLVAHASGHLELAEGAWTPSELAVRSTAVVGSSSAKSVVAIERIFRLDGDSITYDLAMAAVGVPMTQHLHAELHRTA